MAKHCGETLRGEVLEHPHFGEIYDKIMVCAQNFPKNIVPSKFEAESVLSNVLKIWKISA